MHLASIQAYNFKNYQEVSLSFSPVLNLFTGPNGSGKTNLLDAIYFLCLTKSAFHSSDAANVNHDQEYFTLKGVFDKSGKKITIQSGFQKGQKKSFLENKNPYEKISDHIGKFPAVLITPYDTDLIREGSEERRKFFDSILSQTNPFYLDQLLKYNKILKQRNALLKTFADQKRTDLDLLTSYDIPLISTGERIHEMRRILVQEYIPLFTRHYAEISESAEKVELVYESDFEKENFKELFIKSRHKDLLLQRTTMGIHKDEFPFKLGSHSMKTFGSQGQQKSFVIALKLAQFEYIERKVGIKPILLLDDIFDKLDQSRIKKLLSLISGNNFGQIFITEARGDRVDNFFKDFKGEMSKFNILNGKVLDH